MDLVSLIVPVHNGSKYLKRLYNSINRQSFKNLEIIFVENFSKDNSLSILEDIAKRDKRVVVLESRTPGTSMARKKGIEYVSGKYTVFMDQDDEYINQFALQGMYDIIEETKVSICQFSIFKKYNFGLKKKINVINERRIMSVADIRNKEIAGMYENSGGGCLSATVWSKIYLTTVLKDAIQHVKFSLYFAEDLFLNTCAMLSDKVTSVCVDPHAFYVWDTRYGFSGKKDSGNALFKDYNQIKPVMHQMLKKANCSEDVVYRLHLESLYFMLSYLKANFDENNLTKTYELIKTMSLYPCIQLAKRYVNTELSEKKRFEELVFLAGDYTPQEFYERFKG